MIHKIDVYVLLQDHSEDNWLLVGIYPTEKEAWLDIFGPLTTTERNCRIKTGGFIIEKHTINKEMP